MAVKAIQLNCQGSYAVWGDLEREGRLFEEFLARCDLFVVNRPGNLATYCNVMGRGDSIDVTSSGLSLVPFLRGWQVEDWSISDHRAIGITLEVPARLERRRPSQAGSQVARRLHVSTD